LQRAGKLSVSDTIRTTDYRHTESDDFRSIGKLVEKHPSLAGKRASKAPPATAR